MDNRTYLLTIALPYIEAAALYPVNQTSKVLRLAAEIRAQLMEDGDDTLKPSDFTRINNDTNGNPRYVCHFLNFITSSENRAGIPEKYNLALFRAKKLGGKKFHNKQYGGGIVFQSYNMGETCNDINAMVQQLASTEQAAV